MRRVPWAHKVHEEEHAALETEIVDLRSKHAALETEIVDLRSKLALNLTTLRDEAASDYRREIARLQSDRAAAALPGSLALIRRQRPRILAASLGLVAVGLLLGTPSLAVATAHGWHYGATACVGIAGGLLLLAELGLALLWATRGEA